jgi:hypothetical protein
MVQHQTIESASRMQIATKLCTYQPSGPRGWQCGISLSLSSKCRIDAEKPAPAGISAS